MNPSNETTSVQTAPRFQDARALPAPPAALWAFGVILAASAIWAAWLG